MTAQVPDTVRWDDKTWQLAASAGDGLFDPSAIGIQPRMLSTANWRGFSCEYAVHDDRLVLSTLRIGLSDEDIAAAGNAGPAINGRAASKRIGIESWFEGLDLPVPFTGTLTLGHDFIKELYVHMGTPAPWAYREVAELRFSEGAIESAEDASARYAAQREQQRGTVESSGNRGPLAAIRDWIRRTFGQ